MIRTQRFCASTFLSTLSLRRATNAYMEENQSESISIHALLAESDHQTNAGSNESSKFLSTLSLRRATTSNREKRKYPEISIHALLAESDLGRAGVGLRM